MEPPLTPERAQDAPARARAARPRATRSNATQSNDAQPNAPVDPSPSASAESVEELILARLDEDKAQDVLVIDLKGKSSLADALVIASGRSQRHVAAMADHLLRALKTAGHGRTPVEGLPHADWVLIDAGDLIVHLFRPEVRAFYNIEKIWSVEPPRAVAEGPAVDDDLDASDLGAPDLDAATG